MPNKTEPPTDPDISLPNAQPQPASLGELALLFLRLGTTAFGGPAAHIAMMRQEIVERRQWLTQAKFLDLIGAASLLPGPSSTEVAIYIGYLRAGWRGLLLAGICFIVPAALLVTAIAWAYVRFGHLPQTAGILYGIKPVVIAVIAQALWALGRTALKNRFLMVVGVLAVLGAAFGVNALLVLLAAGGVAITGRTISQKAEEEKGRRGEGEKKQSSNLKSQVSSLSKGLAAGAVLLLIPFLLGRLVEGTLKLGLMALLLVFVKFGSSVYGSGYVLLAFLRDDLVARLRWLNSAQLLDAVAVGQVTPGPVFTTATFIGYLLAGPKGALVATVGIFLPAFLLVGVSGKAVSRLRNSPITGAFLDGVNVAALALMAVVCWQLGRAALIDPLTIFLAAASLLLLVRYRVNSAWLVLGGALIGLAGTVLKF